MESELIDGSITIDANADIRRTCDITFQVKDRSYLISETSKIWFNKLIRVSYGVKHIRSEEVFWYPIGIYLFNENSYQFDSETNTISVKCLDMMSRLNGVLFGQLGGASSTIIPSGSNIREAMISVIQQLGFVDRYLIDEIGNNLTGDSEDNTVPYDLEFDTDSTVYDVVIALRDIYPGYETFFDLDGTFICQRIPTCKDDPILIDENVLSSELILSESVSNSFDSVHNVTEVWGKENDIDKYVDEVTYRITSSTMYDPSKIIYYLNFSNDTSIEDGDIVGFKVPKGDDGRYAYAYIPNSSEMYKFCYDNGNQVEPYFFVPDKSYLFKFKDANFIFIKTLNISGLQVHSVTIELSDEPTTKEKQSYKTKYNCENMAFVVNPDSPYAADRIGEKLRVLNGGEYEDIYSDDLALQRAKYENWQTTRLQDGVNLNLITIPWLDVNQKVQYKSQITQLTNQYITKSINLSLSEDTMTLNMSTFYPYYPDII